MKFSTIDFLCVFLNHVIHAWGGCLETSRNAVTSALTCSRFAHLDVRTDCTGCFASHDVFGDGTKKRLHDLLAEACQQPHLAAHPGRSLGNAVLPRQRHERT